MTGYRLFLLRNGRICSAEQFEAEDDAAAIREAGRLRRGEAAELWSQTRVVEQFSAALGGEPFPTASWDAQARPSS